MQQDLAIIKPELVFDALEIKRPNLNQADFRLRSAHFKQLCDQASFDQAEVPGNRPIKRLDSRHFSNQEDGESRLAECSAVCREMYVLIDACTAGDRCEAMFYRVIVVEAAWQSFDSV